jgi:hypothetical protein
VDPCWPCVTRFVVAAGGVFGANRLAAAAAGRGGTAGPTPERWVRPHPHRAFPRRGDNGEERAQEAVELPRTPEGPPAPNKPGSRGRTILGNGPPSPAVRVCRLGKTLTRTRSRGCASEFYSQRSVH